MKVALVGATGMTGRRALVALLTRGHDVVAVGRNPERLASLDPRAERRIGDFDRPETLPAALAGVDAVAYVAHAKHTKFVLDAMAPGIPLVVTGSMRVFTKLADPAADAVRAALDTFAESGRPGLILLPAMIYGAPEDRNVGRILRLLARFPKSLPIPVPLPDGGRHTVQPVHVDDLAECIAAAISCTSIGANPVVIAGPEPIAYARMVRECAAALGRRVWIVPVPVGLLATAARLVGAIGLRPPFDAAELRRAAEDKAFDVSAMRTLLGVVPRPFAQGVAEKVAARAF
jgi:uncharacterized protein YbjT (DUF2867 family)